MAHSAFPSGIPSAEAVGSSSVILEVYPGGISSLEAFGSVAVASFGVFPYSIISREATGFPRLPAFIGGIPSEEAVGSVRTDCFPDAISPASAFGIPVVQSIVVPTGISSSEAIGLINYTLFPPVVSPVGIEGGEAFGSALSISIISHSLEYLPVYNQQQDFFKMISDWVDYVRTKDYLQWIYNVDQAVIDEVKEIIPTFHDTEAILAYYKFMINPIIGTRTVLDYITSLLGFEEHEVQEWFDYGFFPWHFKVFLGMVGVPIADFGATYDAVYKLIMEYKNERSFLEELHIYTVLYTDEYLGMIPLCGEDTTIYDLAIMVSDERDISSVASGEAFGSVRLQTMPVGLASGGFIGSPALNGMVPFGIGGGESFGSPRLPVHPVGIWEESFGIPRFSVFPVGITSREDVNIFPVIKQV